MEDLILKISLGKSSVHLVDLTDSDVLRNNTVPLEHGFSFLTSTLTLAIGRHLTTFLILTHIGNLLITHVQILLNIGFLMNQRETDIVLELCDRKIQLVPIGLYQIKQLLCKSTDNGLLVVVYNILEELVDELHLEIRQVEASIIVTIETVCQV